MSGVVTYSPAYTLVPTYECFNRCTYCNFRVDPGNSRWITLPDATKLLEALQNKGVCEILILSGEVHPHSSRRQAWFELIFNLCELALAMGFLPHTNVGPLSMVEMQRLKTVNVSMGLMLEQVTPQLLNVHRLAPSKLPHVRSQQLDMAGELQIPFTTGLLLGIGETQADWWNTVDAIAQSHSNWNHIQEVILQPYSPGTRESWDAPGFNPHQLPEVIAKVRQKLPADITLQIPPNLVKDPLWLLECIDAGARDLGGIGPIDEVNPDYPHLTAQQLSEILTPSGWNLIPRLPVYPKYDMVLPQKLQTIVKSWRVLISEAMPCPY